MIKFKNVTATYENGSGIFDISFEVNSSEMLFLMGPTGSGKSTLLKAIYKDINIDNGELYVDNQDVSNLEKYKIPFLRRNVGMIFQDFKLISDRTAFDNIALPLEIEGLTSKDIKIRVEDVLDEMCQKSYDWISSKGDLDIICDYDTFKDDFINLCYDQYLK